jgi:hypothetical protein
MQRAMARQAEAEREKRAKIIHAQGEFQASQQLAAAADVISRNPVTIQLRYLQTLTEIGAEKNTTVVFPLPIDLISNVMEAVTGTAPRAPRPMVTIDEDDVDLTPPPLEFDPAEDDILLDEDVSGGRTIPKPDDE